MQLTLAFLQHITGIAHTQLNQCPACLNAVYTPWATAVFHHPLKLKYFLSEALDPVFYSLPIGQRVFTIQAQCRSAGLYQAGD